MAKKKTPIPQGPQTTDPPTSDYVWALYRMKQSDGDEARLRTLSHQMRAYTRMSHQLHIPDAYKAITKEVRTPFLRDTWHRTTTALNQKPYIIEIEPRDKRQDTQRAAEIGVRWDTAVRDNLDKEIGENTAIESTKALIRDGESVLKVVHRPDAWANFPERETSEDAEEYSSRTDTYKKGSPLPFAWRVVDRLSMMFGDGEYGDDWALEYGEYPRPYLARQYQMRLINADQSDETLINPRNILGGRPKPQGYLVTAQGRAVKMEYWDKDWWHVVIDGQDAPGFPKPNPYAPRLPYFRAKGPDSESLLYSLIFLVPGLDELLTMKLNWAYLGSYPNPVISSAPNQVAALPPTGDDGSPPTLRWQPGKALTLPMGWNMTFLSPPPIGKDLNDLVSLLREMIDVAGIPSVFRGAGGDNQAGYAINQLMAAASLSFKLAGVALSRQFSRAFEFIHWLIGHGPVDQCVYVLSGSGKEEEGKQWLGLRPSGGVTATEAGVDDLGVVSVRFRPTLPTDEQALAMIAMQLTNAPNQLFSKEYALKHYLQIDDADAMLDQIAVEKAMDSEPLHSMWVQRALEEAGLAVPAAANPPSAPGAPALPGLPGQASGGLPSVTGGNTPLQPGTPGTMGPNNGGRPAAMFPGQPGTPITQGG